jgi:hypothetical protein
MPLKNAVFGGARALWLALQKTVLFWRARISIEGDGSVKGALFFSYRLGTWPTHTNPSCTKMQGSPWFVTPPL